MLNYRFEPDGLAGLTMDEVRAARLVAAGLSRSADDLALVLEALGIGRTVDPAILAAR